MLSISLQFPKISPISSRLPTFHQTLVPSPKSNPMSSLNSGGLSPSSGEATAESSDEIELLEDDTEIDGESHRFSPARTFPSSFTSRWTQPWSKNTENCRSSKKWEWSFQSNTKPSVTGAGMENLGNTCFMNSVLQCFVHTVPILRGVLSDGQLLHSNCNKEGFCMLCALGDLIVCSLTNNSIVSPRNIANNLSYISSNFKRFHQEDAHEFLQCFLDRLENCDNSESKGSTSLKSDNIVKQVFGGRVVSKLKCCNCGHCSDTYEPSVDLSLEIEDADNLLTALQSFTKVERIEDPDTKFTCEKCKEQVSVEKKLSFDQAPSVAVFHLKRLKNDGCFVQKIDKHVSFPLDLDLLPFTGSNEKTETELKYVLYAVVVHIGLTSTSGHYYCFIRLSPNTWCKFDDSKVMLVSEEFVLSQDAYILFYAKESTPWFSSFIESQKEFVHSSIWNTSPKSVLDNLVTSLVSPCLEKKYVLNPNEATHGFGSEHVEVDNNEIKRSGSSPGFGSGHSKFDNNEVKKNGPSHGFGSAQSKIDNNEVKKNGPIHDFGSAHSKIDNNEVKKNGPIHDFGSAHSKVDHNATKYSTPMQNKIESTGSKYIFNRSYDSEARRPSDIPPVYTPTVQRVSPILLKKTVKNQEVRELPDTALRSPSPEIYREDPPDAGFSIPRDLRLAARMSCKRRLDKDMDDPEIRQATSFIKKTMHSSRAQQLLAAIRSPEKEASANAKKNRRLGLGASTRNNMNTRTPFRSLGSRS